MENFEKSPDLSYRQRILSILAIVAMPFASTGCKIVIEAQRDIAKEAGSSRKGAATAKALQVITAEQETREE